MIVRVDGYYSHIECDVSGCGEKSPPQSVMISKHGLSGCGWFVGTRQPHLGKHRCPAHYDADAPAPGPQERTEKQQAKLDKKRREAVQHG
jgi:hypothetical protein